MELARVKAVVTGAAGGLGASFALELVRAGAQVVAGDSNAAGLRQLAGAATSATAASGGEVPRGQLFVTKLDVADEASVAACVAFAGERMAGLNVLINSAGIARDGLLVSAEDGEIKTLPLAQWRKVIDVNLTGQFLMTRAFSAHVVAAAAGDAVVVNLSSIARAGNPGQSNYAASKAGLDACTRTWALELARHGIRVGGIAPGVTETPFLAEFSAAALARLQAGIPLGRLGRPHDVWQAVRFIVECDYFTGRTVEVDGGAGMGVL